MHYETAGFETSKFITAVRNFIEHTMTLDIFKINGWLGCPYRSYGSFVPRMDLSQDILYGLIEKVDDGWYLL
ncbi:hypothetical protein H5410_057783 [Solanum commersonii]|uniref:Uncharacterized protein n=1 Tax=Solanum commersonii TaxID=4109 RepID=A0A9J5WP40_SOLCO|nr:hypothetical protein H5410_057783 [Solanum commersonii]